MALTRRIVPCVTLRLADNGPHGVCQACALCSISCLQLRNIPRTARVLRSSARRQNTGIHLSGGITGYRPPSLIHRHLHHAS